MKYIQSLQMLLELEMSKGNVFIEMVIIVNTLSLLEK